MKSAGRLEAHDPARKSIGPVWAVARRRAVEVGMEYLYTQYHMIRNRLRRYGPAAGSRRIEAGQREHKQGFRERVTLCRFCFRQFRRKSASPPSRADQVVDKSFHCMALLETSVSRSLSFRSIAFLSLPCSCVCFSDENIALIPPTFNAPRSSVSVRGPVCN